MESKLLRDDWPSIMKIWRIMEDITSGIAFIHFHKEVHRDLKPRNGIAQHL